MTNAWMPSFTGLRAVGDAKQFFRIGFILGEKGPGAPGRSQPHPAQGWMCGFQQTVKFRVRGASRMTGLAAP